MRTGSRRLAALFLLVVFWLSPAFAGDFISDFFAQKTQTSGGYYEGNRRGYVTGGSFNARWRSGSDYLVSIQKPRLKLGCGGIDLFLGGYSFVNMEFLGKKLQQIAQNAPVLFLDLAIANMMQQLSNSMKTIDALIESLNGLQLDDCKAGKAVAVTMANATGIKTGETTADAWKTFASESGASTFYKAAGDAIKSAGDTAPIPDKPSGGGAGPLSDCPVDLNKVLLNVNTTVLDNIRELTNMDAAHVPMMRGLVGDIAIKDETGEITWQVIAPCSTLDPQSVDDFLDGNTQVRLVGGATALACSPNTDPNKNIQQWVMNQLTAIRDAMKSPTGNFTSAQLSLLDTMPNVKYILNVAVRNGTSDAAIADLAPIAGKLYAYAIMRELYGRIFAQLNAAKRVLSDQAAYKPTCQTSRLHDVEGRLGELSKNVFGNLAALHATYAAAVNESNVLLANADHYVKQDEAQKKKVKTAGGK